MSRKKIPRNAPCPCGSGRKYKNCCYGKAFDWVDTSSPRGTMNSFLMGTQRYYDLIREDGYTRDNWRELTNIITQAERLFDLRMVPSGHRRDVAHETTALIREAIARVPLPKLGEIPDEDKMAARVMAGQIRGLPCPEHSLCGGPACEDQEV